VPSVEQATSEMMDEARYRIAIGLEKQITIIELLERARMCRCADGIVLKKDRLGSTMGWRMVALC
jgi:hypothetical protein